MFSVQQVRNLMEGENSRWKDNQCEPTENQRGNSDVQIENVVFVWRRDGTRLCVSVLQPKYVGVCVCVCVCVSQGILNTKISGYSEVWKKTRAMCVCVCVCVGFL